MFGLAAAWAIAKFEFSTTPLHIETLYMQYNHVGAFAVASILTLLAVVTLILKTLVERRVSGV